MLKFLKNWTVNRFHKENVCGIRCPMCSRMFHIATAKMYSYHDKRLKKWMFYVKCDECGRTSPAYEKKTIAIENWGDQWILFEDYLKKENA